MDERKIKQAVRGLYSYNLLKRNKQCIEPIDKALNSLSATDRELIFKFYINHKRKSVWAHRSVSSRRSLIYARAQKAFERYIESYCRKE